jgi:hypothetical protein
MHVAWRFIEGARRLSARHPKATGRLKLFIVIGVVVAVWGPFLASRQVDNELSDWSYRSDYEGYGLHAIFTDRQFPFWVTSPRFQQFRVKGVHDFFGNPETEVLSPVTPLSKLFGYLVAIKIDFIGCLVVGVIGCQRLLRAFGAPGSFLATLLLSLLVLCNGALVAHVLVGHTQFMSTAMFPMALALFIEAWNPRLPPPRRALRAAGAGAILAVAYYAGNAHLLLHFLLLFVGLLTAISALFEPRGSWPMVTAAAVVVLSFVALSAFKLFPGLADFGAYHAGYLIRFAGWRDLLDGLVVPWRMMGGDLRHERAMYIGWAGVAVIVAACVGWNRKTVPLLIVALAVTWLMCVADGNRMLAWPLIRTQGALTRMRLCALLALVTVAVVRIDGLLSWARHRHRRWIRTSIVSLALVLDASLAVDLACRNVAGSVQHACGFALPVADPPFDVAPRLEPEDSARWTVEPTMVTANAYRYDFAQIGSSESTLLVAPEISVSGHRSQLKIRGDGELTSKDGSLAVRPRGSKGQFTLYFFDPVVWWGLVISATAWLALGAAVGVATVHRRRPALAPDGP